jgi:hypothetical protein
VSLATKLLSADVPVAAMALTTWARPEKSAAGFHLSPPHFHCTRRDGNAILLTFDRTEREEGPPV